MLLGDAALALSPIAGKGVTLAVPGAIVLVDSLVERPGTIDAALPA